jgi:hypothetical protein
MQEVPPTEPAEGVWDTVGEPAGSRSPAPTVEEILAQLERQPPAAAIEEVVASGAQESAAPAAVAEEAVAAGAQEEEPAEGGLVDIASILSAPAVTIVQSNL